MRVKEPVISRAPVPPHPGLPHGTPTAVRSAIVPPRRTERRREHGDRGWGLQLALHLLLAGLFAALLARSDVDPERAQRVLQALAELPSASMGGAAWGLGEPDAAWPTDRVDDPVVATEPLTASERQAGLLARIRLAGERLFAPDGNVRRWRLFLLARLARRSRGENSPSRRLEILVPTAELANGRAAARLNALLAALERLGARRKELAVGLGPPGDRHWTFRLWQRLEEVRS